MDFKSKLVNSELPLLGSFLGISSPPLVEMLGQAGYDTFMTGKWHNRDAALKVSFKKIGPTGPGMYPSTDIQGSPYHRPAPGNNWSPYDKTLTGHWLNIEGKIIHSSQHWADAAIDYLTKQAANQDDPFFMYVAFHAPHDPRQSPKKSSPLRQ